MRIYEPTMPTININGSDATQLMTTYLELSRSAEQLATAMAENRPHPRDYQLAPERYEAALHEYEVHYRKVRDAQNYLMAVAVNIHDQKG